MKTGLEPREAEIVLTWKKWNTGGQSELYKGVPCMKATDVLTASQGCIRHLYVGNKGALDNLQMDPREGSCKDDSPGLTSECRK